MAEKDTAGIDWEELKRKYESANAKQQCPHCGYCPHCGRGGYGVIPYYPPPYITPWWQRPWYTTEPVTITSAPNICGPITYSATGPM